MGFIEKLLTVWIGVARRGSWLVVLVFLAGAWVAGQYAARTLTFETDTSAMLSSALPFQQRAAELNAAFPEGKAGLIIIVRGQTIDEAEIFAARLAVGLKGKKNGFSRIFAPAEEPFFQEHRLLYLDENELESQLAQMTKTTSLIEALVKAPSVETFFTELANNDALAGSSEIGADTLQNVYEDLAVVLEASLNKKRRPFSWVGAISAEEPPAAGYLSFVYVMPEQDASRLEPAKAAIDALQNEIVRLKADFAGDVETYVTGGPALRGEELRSVTRGIGLSLILSFVLVAGLLFFAYRSVFMAALSLVGLVITIIFTTAIAAFAVGELNLISAAFTVLLVGLGLDFAIHLLLHVQERRAAGQAVPEALKGAIHEVGPALTLAAPTTALAFFSFIPTKFDGIAELGVIAGAGVIVAFFVSITFLPAALSALPNFKSRKSTGRIRSGFRVIEKISLPVAVLAVGLGFFALTYLPDVHFDSDPMALRDPASQSVRGYNLLFENETTVPYRLTRLVSSKEEAIATSTTARALDVVRGTRSLPDFVPGNQDEKLELIDFAAGTMIFALDAAPGSNTTLNTRAGIEKLHAQLGAAGSETARGRLDALLTTALDTDDPSIDRLIEENIFAFWPAFVSRLRAQFEAGYIDIDALPNSLLEQYKSPDGQWRVDILPKEDVRDRTALLNFINAVETVYPDVGGGVIQALKAGDEISRAMLQASAIAISVIIVVLMLLIRRVTSVALILAPLMLAAVLTVATSVYLGISFNYANVIVLPLIIGIGVDSGIHLVMRQRQLAAGEGLYGTSTPRAVLFSALTTVASFGSLMLASHRGIASLGELLTIAIGFTLICTLIVLPAALRYREMRAVRAGNGGG